MFLLKFISRASALSASVGTCTYLDLASPLKPIMTQVQGMWEEKCTEWWGLCRQPWSPGTFLWDTPGLYHWSMILQWRSSMIPRSYSCPTSTIQAPWAPSALNLAGRARIGDTRHGLETVNIYCVHKCTYTTYGPVKPYILPQHRKGLVTYENPSLFPRR